MFMGRLLCTTHCAGFLEAFVKFISKLECVVGNNISILQARKQYKKVKKFPQIIKLCKWQSQDLKPAVWLQIPFSKVYIYTDLRVSWCKLVLWTLQPFSPCWLEVIFQPHLFYQEKMTTEKSLLELPGDSLSAN